MKSLRIVAAILCIGMLVPLTGCSGQQTAAELIGVVGTAVASLETIEGNTSNVAAIETATQAAETAIADWKSGTPATDIVEALSLLQTDLSLLPVSSKDEALVDLALGTVEQIVALFPATSAPEVSKARAVTLTVRIRNRRDFKKQWNKLVSGEAQLSGAAIK